MFNAVPLLTLYLALLCFVPAVWVFPGLGAAGPPASIAGMGLFALWGCIQLLPNIHTRRSWLRWPLLINTLVLLVSYALGQDRGLSIAESLSADRALLKIMSMNGVILMASEGLPTMLHANQLTKRLTYFGGAVAAIGMVQFFVGYDPFASLRFPGLVLNSDVSGLGGRGTNNLIRVKAGTLHPIEFATVMALAMPLAFHHASHEPNDVMRRRRFMLAGLITAKSLLAVSRTAVVAVAAAGLVLFWGWSPKFRLKAMVGACFFLVVMRALIPGLLGTLFSLFATISEDSSISGRTEDYAIVAQFVADRPWFGRGTGTFIPSEYILLDNAYLGRLAETGYIGFLSLLMLLLCGFFMARHGARRHPSNKVRHSGVAIAAMVTSAIVGAGTFDLLSFPTSSGFLFLALGLASVVSRCDPPLPYRKEPAPADLLRLSYRRGYVKRPWWHRFDPELRNHRERYLPSSSVRSERPTP